MPNTRCEQCGYAMIGVLCPQCNGRVVGTKRPASLSPTLRAAVTPGQFITRQHYDAWRQGAPLRTHRVTRWKVPKAWREMVKRQCRYRCTGCGARDTILTLEHIVPAVFGGSNEPSNLTTFCHSCQRKSWARFRELLLAVDAEGAA